MTIMSGLIPYPTARAALPNGVAAGDVSATSAVVWAKCDAEGSIEVEYHDSSDAGEDATRVSGFIEDPEVPVKAELEGLTPDTEYEYVVRDASGDEATGRFRTPAVGERRGLRFGVSGDWRGELAPFVSVRNAARRNLDLFVGLGDTIYADVPSPAVPADQATTLDEFRAKHQEVYGERSGENFLADLRASTAILVMIDDHEVTNDFAGAALATTDERFDDPALGPDALINESPLFTSALQAFLEYNPVREEFYGENGDPRTAGRMKLYRHRTYGLDAAFFLLDSRTFRDEPLEELLATTTPAEGEAFYERSYAPGRTMLGAGQLAELKADLLETHRAGVLWKFILVPEPIQNLGPYLAADRFEGYSAERADLLGFIDRNSIPNVVFIAADIHGMVVNDVLYRESATGPQNLPGIWEITTGPVAYDAPFGPTIVDYVTPEDFGAAAEVFLYWYGVSGRSLRDAWINVLGDLLLAQNGLNPIGLADGPVDAHLTKGGYVNVHTYGWTEFEIDAETGRLTTTSWGIDPYAPEDVESKPAGVLVRHPAIVSRFHVDAEPLDAAASPSTACGAIGLVNLLVLTLGLGIVGRPVVRKT